MFEIIDGKKVSAYIKDTVKEKVLELNANGEEITLAVIIVGNDPASRVYVNNKKKACEYVGFKSLEYALPEETSEEELAVSCSVNSHIHYNSTFFNHIAFNEVRNTYCYD